MKNTQDNSNSTKEAAIIELLVTMLLSDGKLSEGAMEKIRAYLAVDRHEEVTLETLQRVLLTQLRQSKRTQSLPFFAKKEDIRQGWARLARTLDMNPDIDYYRNSGYAKPARRWSPGRVALRVAAVLIPAMIVGGYFWRQQVVERQQTATSTLPFVATNRTEAGPDSVKFITLPDGSEVTLNRNATFAYNDHREAELRGEAWFEVAADAEHPFVIHSENLTIRVLGTRFNFDTGAENRTSRLSLYDGAVELDYAAGTRRMDAAGTLFTLDHATGATEIHAFDTTAQPEWLAQYRAQFGISSLDEIFDRVESHYGVRIVNREVIDTSRRYTFSLDGAGSVESVMRTLAIADGRFDYTIAGTTITLDNKPK